MGSFSCNNKIARYSIPKTGSFVSKLAEHFRANCSPLECGFAAVIDGPAVCVLSVLRVCCGVSNL